LIKKILVRDLYGPLKILEDDGSLWERQRTEKGVCFVKISEGSK